jgi:nicotinamidase-related amidase
LLTIVTVSALDPATALIVVDLQRGIVGADPAPPVAGIVAHALELVAAFRRHELPVVLVNVAGGAPGRSELNRSAVAARPEGWDELIPELDPQPGDIRVTKHTWGAFTGTGLDDQLRSRAVTQVVACGIATSIGVESTAPQAHELGYTVTLAVDAMTDLTPEGHANSLARVFPRLGELGGAAEIVGLLEQRLTR